jgi:hypothetical protein
MVDTQGGWGGGLARGLQAGLALGGQAQDREQRAREFQQQQAMREQEIGLQSRQAERADQQALMQMHKFAYDTLNEQLKARREQAIGIADRYGVDSDEAKAAVQQIDALQSQQQQHVDKINAPLYFNEIQKARQTAAALKDGADPMKTPSEDLYKAGSLTGHAMINYVDGHDHDGSGQPNQRAPLGKAIDAAAQAMESGDHQAARDHLFPVLMPYTPHTRLPEDNEGRARPGFRGPWGPPDGTPYAPIAHTGDLVGGNATMDAAVNAGPKDEKGITPIGNKIIEAHDQGATDRFYQLRNFAYRIRGIEQLPRYMMPDEREKTFLSALDAGYGQKDAWLMAYAPGVKEAQVRIGAEAPLRNAQVAEANQRVEWLKRRGLAPDQGPSTRVADAPRTIDQSGSVAAPTPAFAGVPFALPPGVPPPPADYVPNSQ